MDERNQFDFPSNLQNVISSQGGHSFNEMWHDVSRELLNNVGIIDLDTTILINEDNQQNATLLQNSLDKEMPNNNQLALVPSVPLPIQSNTVGSNVCKRISSLPGSENWPGEFNFNISFSSQPKNTKGVAWTYSRIKDKLYVGKDAACPVNFFANTKLPDDVYIRAMVLYTSPEQVNEVVERCLTHSLEEMQNGYKEARHLIRCESAAATYHSDAVTGHHSVVVPFENPPAGQEYFTSIYKFACFGSCAGGPNRRPLMLIFTLERDNQIIGRRKIDVKICACPGRDKKTEENQHQALHTEQPRQHTVMPRKRKLNTNSMLLSENSDFTKDSYLPLPKKNKVTPVKDGLYSLHTDDIKCYEFLKQMKKFFEISKAMRGANPDALSKALRQAYKIKKENID